MQWLKSTSLPPGLMSPDLVRLRTYVEGYYQLHPGNLIALLSGRVIEAWNGKADEYTKPERLIICSESEDNRHG